MWHLISYQVVGLKLALPPSDRQRLAREVVFILSTTSREPQAWCCRPRIGSTRASGRANATPPSRIGLLA